MSKTPADNPPFPTSQCVFNGYYAAKGNGNRLLWRIGLPYGILTFLLYGGVFYAISVVLSDAAVFSGEMTVEAMGKVVVLQIATMVSILFIMASGMNASYRWYLNNDLDGYFGALRFGMDEMRTMGVMIVYGVVVFVLPYIVLIMVFGLGLAAGASLDSFSSAIVVGLLFIVAIPGLIAAMVYLSVKLSLCIPLSLERKQFTLFGSLRLTRGRGWELLSCYFIMGLIYMVVGTAISTIQNILFAGKMMPMLERLDSMSSVGAATFETMRDLLVSPEVIAGLMVVVFFQTLVGLLFLFGYTGLTSFSLRFLQKEKGDLPAS